MNPILSPVSTVGPKVGEQSAALEGVDASLFAEALQAQIADEDEKQASANEVIPQLVGQGIQSAPVVSPVQSSSESQSEAKAKGLTQAPIQGAQVEIQSPASHRPAVPSVTKGLNEPKADSNQTSGVQAQVPGSRLSVLKQPEIQSEKRVSGFEQQSVSEAASRQDLTQPKAETQASDGDMALPADLLARLGLSVESLTSDAVSSKSQAQRTKSAGSQATQASDSDPTGGASAAASKKQGMSTESFLDLRAPLAGSGKLAVQGAKEQKASAKSQTSLMHDLTPQPHLLLQGQTLSLAGPGAENSSGAQTQLSPQFVAELGNAMTQIAAQPSKNGEIRIRMNPEHLGEVRLFVKANGDQVSVRIDADNPSAKALFEGSVKQLEAGLAGQNLVLRSVEVGSVLPGAAALRTESADLFREPLRLDSQNRSQQDQSDFSQAGKQGGNAHERYNQRRALFDERLDRIA